MSSPKRASEEHNVEQKGSVSLIVRRINPNQLWEGILTSEGLGRGERTRDRASGST